MSAAETDRPDGDARLAASRADIERWLSQDRADAQGGMAPSSPPFSTSSNGLGGPDDLTGPRRPSGPPSGTSSWLIGALATAWLQRPSQAPLRAACLVADAALAPLARRHPLALVGGAFGAGAVLGVLQPWRWWLRPAVLVGVLTPLVTPLVSQIAARCLQAAPPRSTGGARPDAAPAPAARAPTTTTPS